jgi:hypothetical protein
MLEEWNAYRRRVIPADASPVQIKECRRSFYAGAWAFYQIQMNGMEDGDNPTEADLALMGDLDHELRQFNEAVKAGRL